MAFMCALTGLFFVVTGFQIWCPKYLALVTNLKKSEIDIYFEVTVLTGPTFGVIAGGIVTSNFGGFTQ